MYFVDNMKQIDIVKYFNCSKGTISDIIKKLKNDDIFRDV
jgi:DNA-binding transcriptional regulator LsrR (DeoR family)